MKLEPFTVEGRDQVVPGFVATNPNGIHQVYLTDEDGRFYADDLTAVRLDVPRWRQEFLALQLTGGKTIDPAISVTVAAIAEELDGLKKGGRGGEAFKAVREKIRGQLRTIGELLGDDDLVKTLWDQVGPARGGEEDGDE